MDSWLVADSIWMNAPIAPIVLAQVNQVQNTGSAQAPAGEPSAQQGGGSAPGGGGIEQILFLVAIFAVFYFLIIRPQQKRAKKHRELVASIAVGDKVITNGGMYGRVVELDSATATIEVDKNVRVRMLRSFVAAKQQEDSSKDAEALREAG